MMHNCIFCVNVEHLIVTVMLLIDIGNNIPVCAKYKPVWYDSDKMSMTRALC